jgi:hypothetical protein
LASHYARLPEVAKAYFGKNWQTKLINQFLRSQNFRFKIFDRKTHSGTRDCTSLIKDPIQRGFLPGEAGFFAPAPTSFRLSKLASLRSSSLADRTPEH